MLLELTRDTCGGRAARVLGEHRPQGGAHTFGAGRGYQAGADGGDAPSVDVLVLGEQGDDDKRAPAASAPRTEPPSPWQMTAAV